MAERDKVPWVDDRCFERDGLVVQVRKLPLSWPRFSLLIGRRTEKGISRFLPLWSERGAQVRIKPTAAVLGALVGEAEDYIRGELQYAEDSYLQRQQARELRELDRDRPRARRGLSGGPGSGKTARKRANRLRRLREGGNG